jgi:hypothetical protein
MALSEETKAGLTKLFTGFGENMGKGLWTSLTYLPKTKTVYLQTAPGGKTDSVEVIESEPQSGGH